MGVVRTESVKGTIASYIGAAIGLFNQIFIYTNLLPVKIVGLIKVLQSFANIFTQLAAFNIHGITVRFFPFFRNKNDNHNGFLFFSLVYAHIGFLLMLALTLMFNRVIIDFFAEKSPLFIKYYYLAFPIAYATIIIFVFISYLWSNYKVYYVTIVREVYLRIFAVLTILIYYLNWIDLNTFLWLFTGTYFLITLLLIIYVIRIKQFNIKPDFTKFTTKVLKEIARFGTWTYLSSISQRVILEIDKIMIARYIGLESAGVYGIAAVIGNVISIPQVSMTNITNPVISEAYKNNDFDIIKTVYRKTSLTQTLIGGLLLILVWFNIDSLFSLMNPEFAEGKYVILFIGLAKYFSMITGNNGGIIQMSKYYVFNLISNLATLIIAIIAFDVLIRRFGIDGAAYAFLIAFVFSNLTRVVFIFIKFGISPYDVNSVKAFALLFFVAGLAYLFPEFTLENINSYLVAIVNVIVKSVIICGVFGFLMIKFQVSEDVNDMINKILIRFKLKSK